MDASCCEGYEKHCGIVGHNRERWHQRLLTYEHRFSILKFFRELQKTDDVVSAVDSDDL